MKMKIDLFQEDLFRKIKTHGKEALGTSQVARRLKQLLPTRLLEIKRSHRSQGSAAHAERLALIDRHYISFIEEYVNVAGQALEAKIEHETHLMLVYARQTLRAFRRG